MNAQAEQYYTTQQAFRAARAEMICADRSWLTVAGLHWLQPGENTFGTASTNALILPPDSAPAYAGSFYFEGEVTTVRPAPGVALLINGAAPIDQPLQHDLTGKPDVVALNALEMIVIKRGLRMGIRLFDNATPRRQTFTGLEWYPIDPAYCVTARFVPYTPPRPISYVNVLDDPMTADSPGAIEFTWQGAVYRLDAQPAGDKLFFNFRDATNRDTTYGAGRFLTTPGPVDGLVTVDFNQATNPYCAYTPYGTCPLPPPQNHLPIRIEAGERRFVLA
jgi:uncharacterized protein (DUF1684 family)